MKLKSEVIPLPEGACEGSQHALRGGKMASFYESNSKPLGEDF